MTRMQHLPALQADVDVLAGADEATRLDGLPSWDSLAVLLVISHFEHVHKVEISGAQVRACRTVGDLLALIPLRS
ncbi:MAG: acyl carrier protein [Verrucomicrobiota bacterium]|jgi:acyl carrier protein